ncbi:MAG: NPCBM/NEW2 domain-containing protein, partial [Sarcina sp.]
CELNESADLYFKIDSVLEISSTTEATVVFKNTGNKTIENISLNLKAPDIFKITPISTTIEKLSSGESFTAKWTIILPSLKGHYTLITEATFNHSLSNLIKTVTTSTLIKLLSTPKNGDILSNVDWINFYEICGNFRLNKSICGNPLTINGSSYISGIGTCTNSEIKIFTGGKSIRFSAMVGIDDETLGGSPLTGFPAAIFQVWGDDEKLYDSGVMRYKQSANIYLDLTTYKIITFKTLNGKNGRDIDHCDWINAYFKYNTPCTV